MTPTFYNHLTHCYETADDTTVAAEICEGDSPSDAFQAATIREQQRQKIQTQGNKHD
jgi:hypothetical protein